MSPPARLGWRQAPGRRLERHYLAAAVLADTELTVDELTEALGDLAGPWAADPVAVGPHA